VTPMLSAALAKGVTIDHVNEALAISRANKTKLILYYIAGCEPMDALREHFAQYDVDYQTTPAVTVVLTYIDPQPFTPFHDFDLRQKVVDIDAKEIYRVVNGRNKRVRVMPLAKPMKSLIRTLFARCESVDDYSLVRSLRGRRNDEIMTSVPVRMLGTTGLDEIAGRSRTGAYTPPYWNTETAGRR
jgi:hypothetical protein